MDKSSLKLNKVLNKTGSSLRYSKCVVLQKNKVNAQKRLMKHGNTKNWIWNKILKSKKKINQSRNRMESVKLFIKMTYNSNLFVNVLFSYRMHFSSAATATSAPKKGRRQFQFMRHRTHSTAATRSHFHQRVLIIKYRSWFLIPV